MKIIDTHTHLSSAEFDLDRPQVLERALSVCDAFIDIGSGTSISAFEAAQKLAESHPSIFFTAGVHPHDADKIGDDQKILAAIEKAFSHPKCVAVGECGLDYYYENSSRDSQIKVFEWHKKMAEKYQLPLVIHTRDAEDDTKNILKDYNGKAAFNCFTGSYGLASFGLSKNFLISFSGIITFKNAVDLRETFSKIPIESIMIETDSPFLAPVPKRGKRNETAFIEYTARFLAAERNISEPEFIDQTSKNALRLFDRMAALMPAI